MSREYSVKMRTSKRRGNGIRCCVLGLCLAAVSGHLFAQGSAGSGSKFEPRTIVQMPTAGMLPKGSFALDVGFYQDGGVLLALSAGIFDRFSFGVSYGGSGLLGSDTPVMNPLPGVNVKVRLLEESTTWPAIALGFDSQGKNGYMKDLDRYTMKSPGLYAVASKNYLLAGYLSLHGGVNYSFEHGDDDDDMNVYVGAEKTLGPFLSLVAEYNFAFNDNSQRAIGQGRGYLNFSLRGSVGGGVTVGVNLEDVFKNARGSQQINRTAAFELIARF
jgi:hypothetical protein